MRKTERERQKGVQGGYSAASTKDRGWGFLFSIKLRAGQLSCARRSDFGVSQGARKIRRAIGAWFRSIARESSSDVVPCDMDWHIPR